VIPDRVNGGWPNPWAFGYCLPSNWAGGYESREAFARPVRTYEERRDFDRIMDRIVALRDTGKTAKQTAQALNAEGFAPLRHGSVFTKEVVRELLLRRGLGDERRDAAILGPHEWWLGDLARELKMAWQTLREWAANGWAHGRQTKVQKLWIVWADKDEVKRLRKLRSAGWRGILGYPPELTTPKQRPGR